MITLYVGDNANGKTRKLVDIIRLSRNNDVSVVTNIEKLRRDYLIDENKLQYFKDNIYNDICKYLIFNTPAKTMHEAGCRKLVELLYSKGDILVLDELDALLEPQEITDISECISYIAPLWKDIYISGYDIKLLRMFVNTDLDNAVETYSPNVYLLKDAAAYKLDEDDINECFDEIRG